MPSDNILFEMYSLSQIKIVLQYLLVYFNFSLSDCSFVETPRKKKIWDSTRFGDLSVGSFSTPRRAARNFKIVKSTVVNLRYKNKLLTQKNQRLNKKVNSLNGILDELKKKNLISDTADDNLKVPNLVCCV